VLALLFAWLIAALRSERGAFGIPDFKGIFNKLLDIFDEAKGAVENIFGTIQSGTLFVISLVQTSFQGLRDILTWFGTIVANNVRDGLNAVRDIITWFGTLIANTATSGFGAVRDLVTWFGTIATNALHDLGGTLRDLITWFGTLIANTATSGFSAVRDLVTWFGTLVSNTARDGFSQLRDLITWFGTGVFNELRSLNTTIADARQAVDNAELAIGDKVAGAIEQGTKDAGVAALDTLRAFVKDLPRAAETDIALASDALFKILETLIAGARDVDASSLRDDILREFNRGVDLIAGGGNVAPYDAPRAISEALVAATEYGLAAQLVGAIESMIPFWDATPLSYLANFIGRFSSYDPLINAAVERAVETGLGRPYEQYINAKTQTQIPSEMMFDELLSRRRIDPGTYESYHALHGYNDFWTGVERDAAFRPARIFELARIMQYATVDDATLDAMLKDAAYRDEFIDPLRKALVNLAANRGRTKLESELVLARQNGYIDDAKFAEAMRESGAGEQEIGYWSLAATAAYNNATKSELVSVWRSAAAKDAMSDDELRAALAGIGVTGDKADIEVARANAARLKKPVNETAIATTKAENAARTTYTSAYKEQFKKGLITADELQSNLVAIGIPDFQAAAIVALAKADAAPAAAVDTTNTPAAVSRRVHADLQQTYITQFEHDLIDADQLRAALLQIGVNDLEAQSIVAREIAKKTPSPKIAAQKGADQVTRDVQSTTAKAYQAQFQQGLLTADQYEAALVQIGIDPAVASATVLLDESRFYVVNSGDGTPVLTKVQDQRERAIARAYVEQFLAGEIDDAQLQQDLTDAGIDTDIAAATVAYELARLSAKSAASAPSTSQASPASGT
jgi:hypothetical protein